MSKWIDAEWLKEHIEVISYEGMWHETETDEFVSVENINSAPSIDIVRCQECKYTEFCEKKIHRHGITYSIDFCSYGVRNCSEKPNNSTIEDCSDVGKE